MTIRRIRRAFYRRNIGPGFCSTAGLPTPVCILGRQEPCLALRAWSPACLCCAVGMQCDPRSLGNLLFQTSKLILELLFMKRTHDSLFSSPPCLEKGSPFPDFPSASIEFERSSASLIPSTSDPSAPSQLHPTRARALWADSARTGQSSSAVHSPNCISGGDHCCPCT